MTSTVPQPEGAIAVSWLGDVTMTFVAALLPKLTVVPRAKKSVPLTVTTVEPAPEVGLMLVTAGAENVRRPAKVPHAQPASLGGPVVVPLAAYSLATQTSVGFWGSIAAPE